MIRVYRCKDKCCDGQPRRFWHSELAGLKETHTSWRAAADQAFADAALLMEVTA